MKKKTIFIILTFISIILIALFTILAVDAFTKMKSTQEIDAYRIIMFIGWLIMVIASFIASFACLVQVLKLSGKKGNDKNE
jgi:hypothetical protein